ncbi:MAG: undecaprenyldiphospho-muramoylpentapeptide beta-N-acetylglucosaminyltransferase [Xanthomonadales bacterium]|nr:undecaprenyldiphospho-muramoylpentapeptide beta-N-acetylglucosaminyltransferase [Xanthomonadales bacterium]
MSRTILIMAGGTGGHIFPGIAVGRELRERGVEVVWLGGKVGLEGRLVPAAGFTLETLDFSGVRGKGLATLALAPLRLLRAILAARKLLRRLRPASVLSMGGYAAAPGGIAAWMSRIPLVVHEQNRVPGFTNRLLARFARRLLAGFADSLTGSEWVGNPVRSEIGALAPPAQRLNGRDGAIRILVLGGSQGAQSLNLMLPGVIRHCGDRVELEVRHQSGARHLDQTRSAYAAVNRVVAVEPFVDDMAAAYAWADIVICRAGALTIAELCAAGVASILVPYPQAVDDHQSRNAEVLVEAGAARLVAEGEAFAERLARCLDELACNRSKLLDMAISARALARPDATARIADVCIEVAA